MPVLIDNFLPAETPQPTISYTVQSVRRAGLPEFSTVFPTDEPSDFGLNIRVLRLLHEFKSLTDNWDGEGALAPSPEVLTIAENLVRQLQRIGQKVYHIAPGPNGEVVVDLRDKGNSVEIIFYPNKKRFILFPLQGKPTQGEYDSSTLKTILEWLHG